MSHYYTDEYYKDTTWDKFFNYLPIILFVGLCIFMVGFGVVMIDKGMKSQEESNNFTNFINSASCQEVYKYLLDNIEDIGVGSGLLDTYADRYAQVEKLKELKCK